MNGPRDLDRDWREWAKAAMILAGLALIAWLPKPPGLIGRAAVDLPILGAITVIAWPALRRWWRG